MTMVMVAHAFLTLETLRSKKTSGWTLPRTRREIQYILFTWTGVCAYCGAKARVSRSPIIHNVVILEVRGGTPVSDALTIVDRIARPAT